MWNFFRVSYWKLLKFLQKILLNGTQNMNNKLSLQELNLYCIIADKIAY